ncbi:17387_t:CDS:2, partial [Acaulospora colombiana]
PTLLTHGNQCGIIERLVSRELLQNPFPALVVTIAHMSSNITGAYWKWQDYGREDLKTDPMEPCTQEIQSYPATINGQQVTLIDTPGLRAERDHDNE